MTRFIPKSFYLVLVLIGFGFALSDHLASPSLSDVGSPAGMAGSCAPCGAPCKN